MQRKAVICNYARFLSYVRSKNNLLSNNNNNNILIFFFEGFDGRASSVLNIAHLLSEFFKCIIVNNRTLASLSWWARQVGFYHFLFCSANNILQNK